MGCMYALYLTNSKQLTCALYAVLKKGKVLKEGFNPKTNERIPAVERSVMMLAAFSMCVNLVMLILIVFPSLLCSSISMTADFSSSSSFGRKLVTE